MIWFCIRASKHLGWQRFFRCKSQGKHTEKTIGSQIWHSHFLLCFLGGPRKIWVGGVSSDLEPNIKIHQKNESQIQSRNFKYVSWNALEKLGWQFGSGTQRTRIHRKVLSYNIKVVIFNMFFGRSCKDLCWWCFFGSGTQRKQKQKNMESQIQNVLVLIFFFEWH